MLRLISLKGFALALFLITFAWGQPQHLTPRPPLYGIPAKTLPQGHWVFRGYAIFPHFTQKWNSQTNKMEPLSDGTSFISNTVVLKIRYGLQNRLTAIVNLPYLYKQLRTSHFTKAANGPGDVIAALLYKFYHNKQHRFLFSGLLFTKWPVGKTQHLAADELPLGTGSLDIGVAAMPEWEFGHWDMRWAAFYIARGKNHQHIDLGDAVNLSWSTAYNFSPNVIAESTLLYKWVNKDAANPSYYTFQWIPALQYRLQRTFLVQLVLPLTLRAKQKFSAGYETWIGLYYLL